MTNTRFETDSGLERLNSLLTWWGGPNNVIGGEMSASTERFRKLLIDVQQSINESGRRQYETLLSTNTELTRAYGELLKSRQPQDMAAAQSRIVRCCLDGVSAQAKEWMNLTEQVQACCASVLPTRSMEASRPAGREKSPAPSERLKAQATR